MKQADAIYAIACSVFRPELEALKASGLLSIPVYYLNSELHMRPERLYYYMNKLVGNLRKRGRRIVLVYGDCHGYMPELCALDCVVRTRGINRCELLMGRENYKTHRKSKSFYLLPEWTLRRRELLGQLEDMTSELTVDFMREAHNRLTYLDSGVMPLPRDEIEACARYFDLPFEVLDITTDFLQKAIKEAMDQLTEPKKLEKVKLSTVCCLIP